MPTWLIIVTTATVSYLLSLVVRVLTSREKKVEYRPTLYHCKVMIVDDCWTSIGSANFDHRSFRLNDEANLNVDDADFAREQVGAFEHDQECSRRITLEEWTNHPWTEKLKDRAAGLLRSQL